MTRGGVTASISSDHAASSGQQPNKEKSKPSRKRKQVEEVAPAPASGDWPQWWLMKNEPEDFSIDMLMSEPHQTRYWDGVRGGEAKNHMKKMKLGDKVFFYYSSCKVPRIVGVMTVAREAYPDYFAWDKSSKYYDPLGKEGETKWVMVDVKYERKVEREVSLAELREYEATDLKGMPLLTRPRLSVSPVTADQARLILELAKTDL